MVGPEPGKNTRRSGHSDAHAIKDDDRTIRARIGRDLEIAHHQSPHIRPH